MAGLKPALVIVAVILFLLAAALHRWPAERPIWGFFVALGLAVAWASTLPL